MVNGKTNESLMIELRNELMKFPKTRYLSLCGRRLVFRDGKYHGWYHWR